MGAPATTTAASKLSVYCWSAVHLPARHTRSRLPRPAMGPPTIVSDGLQSLWVVHALVAPQLRRQSRHTKPIENARTRV
jgi:hypothetical protein